MDIVPLLPECTGLLRDLGQWASPWDEFLPQDGRLLTWFADGYSFLWFPGTDPAGSLDESRKGSPDSELRLRGARIESQGHFRVCSGNWGL